jgi:hypothetical protein
LVLVHVILAPGGGTGDCAAGRKAEAADGPSVRRSYPCRSRMRSRRRVLIQVKPLDGYGLGSLAIGRFDVAEEFPATAYNDDAPSSQLSGGDFSWAFGQRREICGLLPRMLPRASV